LELIHPDLLEVLEDGARGFVAEAKRTKARTTADPFAAPRDDTTLRERISVIFL
jgi:hypothetical protein